MKKQLTLKEKEYLLKLLPLLENETYWHKLDLCVRNIVKHLSKDIEK